MESLPWTECDVSEPSNDAIPLVVIDCSGQHVEIVN